MGDFESYKEIADRLKISEKTLYNWRNEAEFAAELKKRIDIKISNVVPKAVKRIEMIIDSKNEDVALRAAKDVLDRAGYKATNKVEVEGDVKSSKAVSISFEGVLDEWSK